MNKLSRTMALTLVLVFALAFFPAIADVAAPTGIYLDGKTIRGLSSSMEYNTSSATATDANWKPVTGMTLTVASGTVTYYFRMKKYAGSTETYGVLTLTVAAGNAPDASDVVYNETQNAITGVDSTMEYNKVSATNGTWTKCTGTSGSGVIKVTQSATSQTYYIRYAGKTEGTEYTPPSQVLTVPITRGTAPTLPGKVEYNYTEEVFEINDDGKWYYTTQSASYTGPYKYEITSLTLRGYPDLTYWFSNSPTGLGSPIKIEKRDNFPAYTIVYNAVAQTFTVTAPPGAVPGPTPGLEYSTNGTTYTNLDPAAQFPQTDKDQTLAIREKATDSKVASWPTYFTVWAENGKVDALQNVRVYKGYILGVSTDLEYFIGTEEEAKAEGAAWTAIETDDIADEGDVAGGIAIGRSDEDQTVWLRVKSPATAGTWDATEIMSVIMPLSYSPPNVTLDILAQTVTGFDPGLSYVYATSSSWKDLPDAMFTDAENKTTVSITSLLTGKAVTLKFARKPATGKPEEESVTAFTIAAGAAKPTVKVAMFQLAESADVLNTGTVTFTGIPDNFQFKLATDTEWSETIASAANFSLEVGYTATAYQFRVAATADKQAGLPGSVKVAAPPKAPKLKVNYKKETFKPKAGSLYSADGGITWLKAPGTEIPVSDYYGGTLFIRLPPTNKKPASDAQELILLPRVPFVPTAQDVSIQKDKKGNDVAVMRSGAWQIEYKNGAKWKKGLPKTLVSDTEIRFMTNTRFAPGESVILTTEGLTNN